MKQPYEDLHKLAEYREPTWFDEEGVPRWCDFEPDLVNDIYADEVALIKIACQSCGRRFQVAMSWSRMTKAAIAGERLSVRTPQLYYGDPPCYSWYREIWDPIDAFKLRQCSGSTMTSENLRIMEFWKREECEWIRVSEFQVALEDG